MGRSSETLRCLLFLAPNTFIALTLITWLVAALEQVRRYRAPKWFWINLAVVTLMFPLLQAGWPNWGLVRYFPHIDFETQDPFLHAAVISLPAFLAVPAAFVHRRLPGYLLSAAGAVYIFLLGTIMLYYNQGIIG